MLHRIAGITLLAAGLTAVLKYGYNSMVTNSGLATIKVGVLASHEGGRGFSSEATDLIVNTADAGMAIYLNMCLFSLGIIVAAIGMMIFIRGIGRERMMRKS